MQAGQLKSGRVCQWLLSRQSCTRLASWLPPFPTATSRKGSKLSGFEFSQWAGYSDCSRAMTKSRLGFLGLLLSNYRISLFLQYGVLKRQCFCPAMLIMEGFLLLKNIWECCMHIHSGCSVLTMQMSVLVLVFKWVTKIPLEYRCVLASPLFVKQISWSWWGKVCQFVLPSNNTRWYKIKLKTKYQ